MTAQEVSKPTQYAKGGPIVVGVDGSIGSRVALVWATEEAALRGSVLELVHAWQYPSGLGAYGLLAAGGVEDSARRLLDDAVDTARRQAATEVRDSLVQGAPAKVLTDLAAGADLLVIGSRGRGGFAGLVLGSVGQHCVAHALCPTVVVHRSDQDPSDRGPRAHAVEGALSGSATPMGAGRPGTRRQLEEDDERFARLRSEMEAASREFIALTVEFASNWIPYQVASVVEGNPAHAIELGTSGLGALKAEMREMLSELPVASERIIGSLVAWPHRLTDISVLPAPWDGWHEVDQLMHRPPDELTDAVAKVIGQTMALLVRHGFARGPERDRYVANYNAEVTWTPAMLEMSNTYCRLYQSFYGLALRSVQEADSTTRIEARRLWDES